ncbi:MAG TPA: hypothetical protein VKU00_18680 [Chthonomonadaceae bacterium]|nr:hypothetical protein [Chthonomonadaceae bacterium]
MKRREVLGLLGGLFGLGALLSGAPAHAGQRGAGKAAADYAKCAKACNDCMATCQACTKHCEAMIKAGTKGHETTQKLSADCADICAAAAKICNRQGPMTVAICAICARACESCGAACAKYPDMKPMQDCVKSCKVCAAACHDMVKALQ